MAEAKTDDITQLMIETARVQVATLNAGIEFWSGWVESASKFAIATNQEIARIRDDGEDSSTIVSRLTDLNRGFLRETTELPAKAVARFTADIEKGRNSGSSRPPRAAKAKQ